MLYISKFYNFLTNMIFAKIICETHYNETNNTTDNSRHRHSSNTIQTSGRKRSKSVHTEKRKDNNENNVDGNRRRRNHRQHEDNESSIPVHTSKIEFDILKIFDEYDNKEELTKL